MAPHPWTSAYPRPSDTKISLNFAEDRLAERNLPAAIAAFNRAELAGASADCCAGGRWTAHMLAGNFAAAWGESDAIRRRGAPDPHRFWTGESLRDRRVILRCLHGYGDAVQFLRYCPRLRELAAHVIVEAPPAMMEIASCIDGVDDVITWDTEARGIRNWDVQVEVTELPYIFRSKATELPLAERYLHLPAEVQCRAKRAMGCAHSPRVGLVWAAGEWNMARSIPFDLLRPLLRCSQCEFWNLQGGPARAEWQPGPHLRDGLDCGEGILALATTISQLDLVITVDTLAAHLAGALGKEAWLLLQHAADWRWMIRRSDSPWYPSLRLFRQPAPGAWASILDSVTKELTRWVATRRDPRVPV